MLQSDADHNVGFLSHPSIGHTKAALAWRWICAYRPHAQPKTQRGTSLSGAGAWLCSNSGTNTSTICREAGDPSRLPYGQATAVGARTA